MSKKLFALLFVMLMLCGAALADGITVTDMHGREIALDQPATRIVALTPSDCEILCAIGCEDALVGRGKYCDYPESISALPVVQSGAETNIEEILALDPQVVLMSDMSQTEEQAKLLEQNGVKVVISDANDIAGVYTAIRMIGALMAKDDAAEALIGDMQADQMRTVAAVELPNLKRLSDELEWFMLKYDFRNADKPWGNSRDAVERSINKLMGACVGDEAKMPAHND